jgi:uridine kinase
MPNGIIIFGGMGSGKTTLGTTVTKKLDWRHFDLDDYIWRSDTDIPFTVTYTRQEKIERLMRDISAFPHFVMSGSMDSFNQPFVPMFTLAVFVTACAEVRAERVRHRELALWGDRVLPGGDMYEAHCKGDYLAQARQYDTAEPPDYGRKNHEQWASTLPCPVLYIDGEKPVEDSAMIIQAAIFNQYY